MGERRKPSLQQALILNVLDQADGWVRTSSLASILDKLPAANSMSATQSLPSLVGRGLIEKRIPQREAYYAITAEGREDLEKVRLSLGRFKIPEGLAVPSEYMTTGE